MPRKRDFVLFGLVVLFLVTGIISTSVWQSLGERLIGGEVIIKTGDAVERTALLPELPDEATLRQRRLEEMRARLAAERDTIITAPEPEAVAEATIVATEPELPPAVPTCPTPTMTQIAWDPRSLTLQESEGALIVYRIPAAVITTGTSTETYQSSPDVLLQIPLRMFAQQKECITTDIIGIAMDGSLIRNTETALYGIFGPDTQVGYTLDGFPLYGSSGGMVVDECGGATVAGSYRYYVGSESILGCFMAEPIVLR